MLTTLALASFIPWLPEWYYPKPSWRSEIVPANFSAQRNIYRQKKITKHSDLEAFVIVVYSRPLLRTQLQDFVRACLGLQFFRNWKRWKPWAGSLAIVAPKAPPYSKNQFFIWQYFCKKAYFYAKKGWEKNRRVRVFNPFSLPPQDLKRTWQMRPTTKPIISSKWPWVSS